MALCSCGKGILDLWKRNTVGAVPVPSGTPALSFGAHSEAQPPVSPSNAPLTSLFQPSKEPTNSTLQ